MNIRRTIVLLATLAMAASAHAQTCSGGPDGGMDATGNQCGSSPVPTSSAAPAAAIPAKARGVARAGTSAAKVERSERASASNARTGATANPARRSTTSATPTTESVIAAGTAPR
jgi:hypothetical protein